MARWMITGRFRSSESVPLGREGEREGGRREGRREGGRKEGGRKGREREEREGRGRKGKGEREREEEWEGKERGEIKKESGILLKSRKTFIRSSIPTTGSMWSAEHQRILNSSVSWQSWSVCKRMLQCQHWKPGKGTLQGQSFKEFNAAYIITRSSGW